MKYYKYIIGLGFLIIFLSLSFCQKKIPGQYHKSKKHQAPISKPAHGKMGNQ